MINVNDLPIYIQVREVLREQIDSGELQPGDKLPSEDQLAATYGISRMTLRRSLNDLIDMGLLYRRHGVGTFVSQSKVQRDHTHLTNFFESCRLGGHQPDAAVLHKEIVLADDHMAQALGIKKGEQLVRIVTLRFIDGTPITYHDAYLPVQYFPQLAVADKNDLGLESQHVWQLIEQFGYKVSNVVERLEARIADDELAEILEVAEGAPILYGERVLYSDDGTPLKYADCYNRGDRFSLTVVLER